MSTPMRGVLSDSEVVAVAIVVHRKQRGLARSYFVIYLVNQRTARVLAYLGWSASDNQDRSGPWVQRTYPANINRPRRNILVATVQKTTARRPSSGRPIKKLTVKKIIHGLRRAVISLKYESIGRQENMTKLAPRNCLKDPSTKRPAI